MFVAGRNASCLATALRRDSRMARRGNATGERRGGAARIRYVVFRGMVDQRHAGPFGDELAQLDRGHARGFPHLPRETAILGEMGDFEEFEPQNGRACGGQKFGIGATQERHRISDSQFCPRIASLLPRREGRAFEHDASVRLGCVAGAKLVRDLTPRAARRSCAAPSNARISCHWPRRGSRGPAASWCGPPCRSSPVRRRPTSRDCASRPA